MYKDLIETHIAGLIPTLNRCPGVAVVHNLRTHSVEFMSERGLALLKTTTAELRDMGPAYHERFFNPDDAQDYVPKLAELMERNDPALHVSFFQQVRTGPEASFEWYSSVVSILLQDPTNSPLLLLTLTHRIDPASHVTHKVQRLLDENQFLREQMPRFAKLTRREREVLRMLALGHRAPDIAERIHISPHTVETHRRNIRQKLGAESVFELGQFARAFDLI